MSTRSPLTAASSALLRYTYDTFFDICTPSDGRPIYDSCVASLHRPYLLSSTATLYRHEGHGESSLAYSPVASSYQCTQPSPEPHEVTPNARCPAPIFGPLQLSLYHAISGDGGRCSAYMGAPLDMIEDCVWSGWGQNHLRLWKQ
jgi:hypothetical protein